MISTIGKALTLASLRLKNRRPGIKRHGERTMAGLAEEAEVLVDRWGIPHVYASNLHDLYFLDGYVQAWDRLWQMDFSRRAATGRLAELLGPEVLPLDRFARRVGFARLAAQNAGELSGEIGVAIAAFTAGVNNVIEESSRPPVEYQILDCQPEPWTAADVLAIAMLTSFTLTPNWDLELIRALLLVNHSAEEVSALEIDHRADYGSASTPGISPALLEGAKEVLREFQRLAGSSLGRAAGSNAWVLSGSRSTTASPLLAGDPHLPASMPNVWHQAHLSAGEIDVIGASIPGIPGIVIGHNRRCAWSVTAGLVDTSDIFLDEGEGDGRVVREEIGVRGGQTVVEEVFVGENGPDIAPALGLDGQRICLKIVLPDGEGLVGRLLALARATNWSEFREALRGWSAPVLNFVYADVHGDIGYQLAGSIPIRHSGKGLLPNRKGEGNWAGYIPFDQLPAAYNPEAGYVVTANHRPAGDDYEHWLGVDFLDGYRADRISELVESREKHSPLDLPAMQLDSWSRAADEICSSLAALQLPDPALQPLVEMLGRWDHQMSADSNAACIYVAFVREFSRLLASRKLGDEGGYWMGRFINPLTQGNGWDFNHAAKVAQLLADRPEGWFDDWEEAVGTALRAAQEVLVKELGADRAAWRYGQLHKLRLIHALGQDELATLLNRGPYEATGDGQCVNATSFAPDGSFDVTYLPGFRHVVDLADVNQGHAVMPGGQSGDPFSTHYNDLTPHWLAGRIHRQYFARTDVVRHSESALRLLPATVS